jgi:hypothetical protein
MRKILASTFGSPQRVPSAPAAGAPWGDPRLSPKSPAAALLLFYPLPDAKDSSRFSCMSKQVPRWRSLTFWWPCSWGLPEWKVGTIHWVEGACASGHKRSFRQVLCHELGFLR